jgi:hypothetical protein
MAGKTRTTTLISFVLLAALLGSAESTGAAVVVFDRVTSVGKPLFVKVVTRGLVFTKGGRRVSIRIDKGPAHDTLSGGDGAAFMKYHPERPGVRTVTAVSEGEEGSGTILVLAPEETVIVIGVEGGLQKSLFPEESRRIAQEVVGDLSRAYRLVYLTRWIGAGMVKDWLEKNQFPGSVVLRWRDERVFKQMKNSGVQVEAVIGSASLLGAAPDSIQHRFTFDENDDASVSGWEDIRNALLEGKDKSD